VGYPGDGEPVAGWELFEHGALGRHDSSGFKDWLTVAPRSLAFRILMLQQFSEISGNRLIAF
jgi:hypothetical protein